MENAVALVSGVLSGAASIPLTYYAARSHREVQHLNRTNDRLRRALRERHDPRPHAHPGRRPIIHPPHRSRINR
jgi:hypothetical protein